jgi:hypothetical protein
MNKQALSTRPVIAVLLILQIIPLLLFPISSFQGSNQELWLPVAMALMTLIGFFYIVVRKSRMDWPWYLMAFAQGFNIISRLMMFMPHTTYNLDGKQLFNTTYVILTLIAMVWSAFYLWYSEWPEVRRGAA